MNEWGLEQYLVTTTLCFHDSTQPSEEQTVSSCTHRRSLGRNHQFLQGGLHSCQKASHLRMKPCDLSHLRVKSKRKRSESFETNELPKWIFLPSQSSHIQTYSEKHSTHWRLTDTDTWWNLRRSSCEVDLGGSAHWTSEPCLQLICKLNLKAI